MEWHCLEEQVRRCARRSEEALAFFVREDAALIKAKARLEETEVARQLCILTAQETQRRAHQRIAEITRETLCGIFGPDAYDCDIAFEQRRGRTEADLRFGRNGWTLNPLSQAGGGAVDVAAFGLRLAGLMLSHRRMRRLLVLDEPFRFLSRDYRARVSQMLKLVIDRLGIQVVMVTHDEDLVGELGPQEGTIVRL